jgi:hypothetical protein
LEEKTGKKKASLFFKYFVFVFRDKKDKKKDKMEE